MRGWNLPPYEPYKRVHVAKANAKDSSESLRYDDQGHQARNLTWEVNKLTETGTTPPRRYTPSFFSNSTMTPGMVGNTNNTDTCNYASDANPWVIVGVISCSIIFASAFLVYILCGFFNKSKSKTNLERSNKIEDSTNQQEGKEQVKPFIEKNQLSSSFNSLDNNPSISSTLSIC